jgi:hypothetical protein
LLAYLRLDTDTSSLLCAAALLGLALLSSCGGGSDQTNAAPTAGPEAILNGATLAGATSHWVSSGCAVQVELTSDYGFYSMVTSTSGTTTAASETWAVGPDSDSVTVGPAPSLKGAFSVSNLGEITRLTSTTFSATVTVVSVATHQSLGSCTFTLAQQNLL